MPTDDGKLDRTLTLQDLTLFGISSALGSGGFNLIGKAVRAGGSLWPALLGGTAALFMGAAWVYSRALHIEGTNTSETDVIERMFGLPVAGVAGGGLLLFHIFAIAVSLVFVAQLVMPAAGWFGQVGLATVFLGIMTWFSLASIEVNKEIINWTTWALLVVLFAAAGLGGLGGATRGLPDVAAPSASQAAQSLLYFVFIFAGAEALVKFTQESVDPQRDLPRAFFTANGMSALLALGVAAAIAIWVPGLTADQECNALGHLFARFAGANLIGSMKVAMSIFVLVTTFIMFLATSRYLYGIGEKSEILRWLTATNEAKAPWKAVAAMAVICFLGLLINNTDTLVKISDIGLIIILGLVAAAVTTYDWSQGHTLWAAIAGFTTAGLGGVLRTVFL